MIKPGARQGRPSTARRRATAGRRRGAPTRRTDRAFEVGHRQVLFLDRSGRSCAAPEMSPGASPPSTSRHMHAVRGLRGRGDCLVGDEVKPVETRDLVTVPAMTWHQFRATGVGLGFLCMVNAATKRSCPRPRTWPARSAMLPGSPRSFAANRIISLRAAGGPGPAAPTTATARAAVAEGAMQRLDDLAHLGARQ